MARLGSSYGNLKRDKCVSSPAIGSDGTVYVGSDDKKLYAINGKTGVKLWEFETGGHSLRRVRLDKKLYPQDWGQAFETGGLMAIGWHGTSGQRTKSSMPSMARLGSSYGNLKREVSCVSSPAIGSDGTVYVGSNDNKLYAIKTESKGPAKSPWPMFGQNAQRTGRASKKE